MNDNAGMFRETQKDALTKIGMHLEAVRAAWGIDTQDEFAKKAKIRPNQYSNYLSGPHKPTWATAGRLKRQYDVTYDWIIDGDTRGIEPALALRLKDALAEIELRYDLVA